MRESIIAEPSEHQGPSEVVDESISPALQLGCLLLFAFVLYELLVPFWPSLSP